MTDKRVVILEDGQVTIGGVVHVLVPKEPTEAMANEYLNANTDYWRDQDKLPRHIGKWRNGTPAEATIFSLTAMLSAAAIDLSGLPRVPERKILSPNFPLLQWHFGDGFNTALDAIGAPK